MTLNIRLESLQQRLAAISQEFQQLRIDVEREQTERGSGLACQTEFASLVAFLTLSPSIQDDELLSTILRCAMHATGAGGAGLTLFDRNKQRLVFRAACGDGAEGIVGYEVPLEGSLHGLAFATGEIQAATPQHTQIEKRAGTGFQNVLVAPLMADSEPIGTLSAVNKQGADGFSPKDMETYKLFSDLAALVIRQRIRETFLKCRLQLQDVDLPEELSTLSVGERERQFMSLAEKMALLVQRREENLVTILRFLESMG